MLYLEVFENSNDLSLSEITKKISSRDVFSYTFLKLNFFHLERSGKKAGLRPFWFTFHTRAPTPSLIYSL